jgi:hypothetical protein
MLRVKRVPGVLHAPLFLTILLQTGADRRKAGGGARLARENRDPRC